MGIVDPSQCELSKSQVNKAGRTIRHALADESQLWDDQLTQQWLDAIETVNLYRASHQKALISANTGLRSMVKTENCRVEVTQRTKKLDTIIDKVAFRETSLALANMQDIGGCRAVLDSIDEVDRVLSRIKRRRRIIRLDDYIREPRKSGYRGVHAVVEYRGMSIEIQLRTRAMHEWALTIEKLSSRFGEFFKKDGTHPVQLLMAEISKAMAIEESGDTVSIELQSRIDKLNSNARNFFESSPLP